jgi:hypothetical protein
MIFKRSRTSNGKHPETSLTFIKLGTLSPRVYRQRSEIDSSHPSSAEVKNAWSCTSTLQYVFMRWCLTKHGVILR